MDWAQCGEEGVGAALEKAHKVDGLILFAPSGTSEGLREVPLGRLSGGRAATGPYF